MAKKWAKGNKVSRHVSFDAMLEKPKTEAQIRADADAVSLWLANHTPVKADEYGNWMRGGKMERKIWLPPIEEKTVAPMPVKTHNVSWSAFKSANSFFRGTGEGYYD